MGETEHTNEEFYRKAYHQVTCRSVFWNILKSLAILAGATMLSLLFAGLGFTESNIIMVYILGVLLTSIVTSHLVYSLSSSIASVFIFNYLFTIPRFSLTAYGTGYPVTFVVMFLTAFVTGTFAIRYKEQAGHAAWIAYRTKILFDANQLLSKAKDHDEILHITAVQIMKLLGRNIVVYDVENEKLQEPHFFKKDENTEQCYDYENEKKVVNWVFENNHFAGATTSTLPDAEYMYFALRVNERVYGVIGIEAQDAPPDAFEHDILISILGESALALENEKNAREKEMAAVLAESEQLRVNLLRTISHDLRTPLTTISGNASNLISNGHNFSEETKKRIYTDIYEDSLWLNNLVENLLYATRIEEGRMILCTSTEVLSDSLEEAMKHIDRQKSKHQISVQSNNELILVKADARLVMQVIVNIVDNAIKYTPEGTSIKIEAKKEDKMAEISISDNGKGISDEEKKKVFDKFYCGEKKIVDNRRSLGLGLYLCKAIIEAHGGTIYVTDNQPSGAVFHFTLPLGEVTLNE